MTSPQINGDPPTEGPAEEQLLAEAFAEDVARAASFAEADAAAATEQPTGPPPADLTCLLYTSPSPRDLSTSRMPSFA